MKIAKITLGVSAIAGVVMIAAGAAYALGSNDFTTRAKSWVKTNCTADQTSNMYSTICYNYYKGQELDAARAVTPTLLDGANGVLGTAVTTDGSAFYNTKLKRIVRLSGASVATNTGSIYYTTSDCSGQAYLSDGTVQNPGTALIKLTAGKYFVTSGAASVQQQPVSYQDGSGTCNTVSWTGTTTLVPLNAVTLPFSDPVAQPLHF